MANNLKFAFIAALLTAVIVMPVFGLQLVRQGARTLLEPNFQYVLIAMGVVFVGQLCRPGSRCRSRLCAVACRFCPRHRPAAIS